MQDSCTAAQVKAAVEASRKAALQAAEHNVKAKETQPKQLDAAHARLKKAEKALKASPLWKAFEAAKQELKIEDFRAEKVESFCKNCNLAAELHTNLTKCNAMWTLGARANEPLTLRCGRPAKQALKGEVPNRRLNPNPHNPTKSAPPLAFLNIVGAESQTPASEDFVQCVRRLTPEVVPTRYTVTFSEAPEGAPGIHEEYTFDVFPPDARNTKKRKLEKEKEKTLKDAACQMIVKAEDAVEEILKMTRRLVGDAVC